jgi:S1-C subfamily serine protease
MKYTGLVGVLLLGVLAHANFLTDTKPYSLISGKIDGMEIIKELPSGTGLAKIGIKKGDIVVSVNYLPIMNLEAAQAAYNSGDISAATILRNNRSVLLRNKNDGR